MLGHGAGGGVQAVALLQRGGCVWAPGWRPACTREAWLGLWRRRGRKSGGARRLPVEKWRWVELGGCVEKIGTECLLLLLFLNNAMSLLLDVNLFVFLRRAS